MITFHIHLITLFSVMYKIWFAILSCQKNFEILCEEFILWEEDRMKFWLISILVDVSQFGFLISDLTMPVEFNFGNSVYNKHVENVWTNSRMRGAYFFFMIENWILFVLKSTGRCCRDNNWWKLFGADDLFYFLWWHFGAADNLLKADRNDEFLQMNSQAVIL